MLQYECQCQCECGCECECECECESERDDILIFGSKNIRYTNVITFAHAPDGSAHSKQ